MSFKESEFMGNWQSFGDAGCNNYSNPVLSTMKDGDKYGVHYFHTRHDADCTSESNKSVIESALAKYMKGKHPTVIEMCDRHWAAGVIEGIAVKVLTSRGHYTKAFLIFRDLMYQMEQYPLLDESDYYQREWDLFQDTLKNEMTFQVNRQHTDREFDIEALCTRFCNECDPDTSENWFPYKELEAFIAAL